MFGPLITLVNHILPHNSPIQKPIHLLSLTVAYYLVWMLASFCVGIPLDECVCTMLGELGETFFPPFFWEAPDGWETGEPISESHYTATSSHQQSTTTTHTHMHTHPHTLNIQNIAHDCTVMLTSWLVMPGPSILRHMSTSMLLCLLNWFYNM